MDKINNTYWVDDCIISSLGFSTKENINNITNYVTNASNLYNGEIGCLINKTNLEEEFGMLGISGYSLCAQICILALKKINAVFNSSSLLVISTTKGNIANLNEGVDKAFLPNLALSLKDHFSMPNCPVIISNACISGISALIYASRSIKNGDFKDVYVVGIDMLSPFIVEGFKSFKSLSKSICRPYDINRDGLTLGEGCAAVHLSSQIVSDFSIYNGGITNDANHISGPSRSGDGLHFAIEQAIGSLPKDELMFINMHGTATVYNDEMESKALNLSNLLEYPVNSLKGFFGHTLGASGVIECIVSKYCLENNIIFGTKGFNSIGTPYNINVSSSHREGYGNWCLKTASGFGGCNAAISITKGVFSYGNGVECIKVKEGGSICLSNGNVPFADFIRNEYKALGVQDLKFSKMDNLCKLAYVGVYKLLANHKLGYDPQRIALVFSNKSASLDSDIKHNNNINKKDPACISPAVFVYTLPNITMGEVAIKHKFMGENTFFVFNDKNLNFVGNYADYLIQSNIADCVIYGWCDYLNGTSNLELKIKEKYNE